MLCVAPPSPTRGEGKNPNASPYLPRSFDTPLPIDAVLDELSSTLADSNAAVLVAPPGAGKTTRVPLALLDAPWLKNKKIIMLEPRRIAARASAERMAKTLGERVGETVGYRVRFGSKVSRATRIEVVTEGIFSRQILDDPELTGVAAVLFDEFHERSLDADLGLALARDAQTGLREDLRILVMSATLDGARVAKLLGDAPVIASEGRAFPVETRYLGRKADAPLERQMADAIAMALRADPGSVLAFLPGAAEIRRTQNFLGERIHDAGIEIVPLFGALDAAVQDRAIAAGAERPAQGGAGDLDRGDIADHRGRAHRGRFRRGAGAALRAGHRADAAGNRARLARRGRSAPRPRRPHRARRLLPAVGRAADRVAGGLHPARNPFRRSVVAGARPRAMGRQRSRSLAFLDPPPAPALKEARSLLRELGALDGDGRITAEGKSLRALALPPRLARMIVDSHRLGAGEEAADIAAVLTERGLGGDSVDLDARLDQFRRDRSQRASSARSLAQRWASQVAATEGAPGEDTSPSTGVMLAFAFPDRVARNRGNGSFVLANGRGAAVDQASALARAPYIAVAELTGTAANGRILLAAPITQADIELRFADQIETTDEISFDRGAMALRARRKRTLHAITLSEAPMALQPSAETARVLADGLIAVGLDRLPWSKPLKQWRDRVMFLRKAEGENAWPDLSDDALAAQREAWLVPALYDKTSLKDISAGDLSDALMTLLPWELRARLEREAPTHFEAPTGTQLAIDYEAEQGPTIAVRLQELFGLNSHPSIAKGAVPLVLELLSPAHRPVQVTRDLPGFWRGSYAAVRSDLRGRYPRHPWPEDPASAMPTRRVKPRGT